MGGTNPYIKTPEAGQPRQKFTIEYQIQGSQEKREVEKRIVEVDPADMPTSATGLHGSILDIALATDVDIDHACGGVCACSTCHVIVKEGLESCSESTEDEEDQLEKAPGLTPRSRLACQCVPNGTKNIVVEVPNWNRNLVREGGA